MGAELGQPSTLLDDDRWPSWRLPWRQGFLLAIALVAGALLLRLGLSPILGAAYPFPFLLVAVTIAAWSGGLQAGLLATGLSGLGAVALILDPLPALSGPGLAQLVGLTVFLLVGGLLSGLCEAVRNTAWEAEVARLRARAREAERDFAIDAIPALLSYVDREQRYRWVNRAYEVWFGTSAGALHGRTLREVLGGEAYATVRPQIEAALAGEHVSYEAEVPYANGTRWVHATYTPDRGPGGEVRGFVALVTDVSERKRAAELLARSEERLRRWEHIFANAGWPVAVSDPATDRLENVNRAFARMHGQEPEELIGQRLTDLIAPDGSREPVVEGALEDDHVYETVHRRKDGTTFPVLIHVSTFRDADERALYRAATFQDITRHQVAEETLRAALRTRDAFLTIASHELRTPLTPLALQLQSVLRVVRREGNIAPERLLEKLDKANRQVAHLEQLVRGMLDVSRLSEGRLVLEPEQEVDLGELVREVAERMAPVFERGGVEVSLEVGHGLTGRWDRARLAQVVANLLDNAVKYGCGRPIQAIVREAPGGQAQLVVRDQGLGISAADQARVFGQFERAVSERHFAGFGLGLWIARQVVEGHGGRIEVESAPERGSTFTVTLPRRRATGRLAS